MSYCDYFSQLSISVLITLVMYWALIMLFLLIIKLSGDWLILVVAVTTFVVSLLMMVIYPMLIAPCFNDFEKLEEGELRTKIFAMCEELDYNMKEIYVQKDSEYTEHSNAYATFSDIFLSDNLIKHHEDHEEILAVVCHEICHDKHYHLIKGAIVDVCYMVLYGVGLSFMIQYGNPIVSSFGFTYQSNFILLFLF